MKFRFATCLAVTYLSVTAVCMAGEPAIISERPEGQAKMMHSYSYSHYADDMDFLYHESHDGYVTEFVYDSDGSTVYIKNPISHMPLGSWIKGTISDGKITINTPQPVAVTTDDDNKQMVWTVCRMTGTKELDEWGDEIYTWTKNTDQTAITFNITDAGIIMDGDENMMLGLCLNDNYMSYGDTEIVYTEMKDSRIYMPEDIEPKLWSLQYGTPNFRIGHTVNIIEKDNEMYISGIWQEQPDRVVKGVIENNKVIIPSNQYLGQFANNESISYFVFMSNSYVAESTYMDLHKALEEDIVFDFDREDRVLEAVNPEHNLMIRMGRTPGFATTSPVAVMKNPSIKENTSYTRPLPTTYLSNCYSVFDKSEIPFVMLEFNIKPFDEAGNVLDSKAMTYSVWVDDRKVVFDSEDAPNYRDLPAPTDELSLDFTNKWGMSYVGDNIFSRRRIQVIEQGWDKIGTQVNFINPENGEKLSSKISYYNPTTKEFTVEEEPTLGIEDPVVESQIIKTEYYNLMGHHVADDFKGLCIKRVQYSNGTISCVKIMKR